MFVKTSRLLVGDFNAFTGIDVLQEVRKILLCSCTNYSKFQTLNVHQYN